MSGRRGPATLAASLAALALLAAGCGGSAASGSGGTGGTAAGRTLTVLAASSLTDAFAAEGTAFQARHPGTRTRFSFAGSQDLVAQVRLGAPADVVATADGQQMASLARAGKLAGEPRTFATNRLEIAVGPGNPKRVSGLADLGRPGLVLVLADPSVPAGHYAADVLARAGVTARPASQEQDVRSVVTKVELGEADAGVVYATDVASAGRRVTGVPIPTAQNVVARYPIAAVRGGDTALAEQFLAFVRGPDGQRILRRYGFGGG